MYTKNIKMSLHVDITKPWKPDNIKIPKLDLKKKKNTKYNEKELSCSYITLTLK